MGDGAVLHSSRHDPAGVPPLRRNRELFEQTIGALANAVDARDRYTRGHSNRVSHISEAMCREMKLPETEIEKIKWAGLLHDVGKIGIRDNILLKPGPLNRDERILMNQHPSIGAEIVAPARQLAPEAPLIRAHHEWINGSGYPDGLEYADIPHRCPDHDHRGCLRGDDQLAPVSAHPADPRAGGGRAGEVLRPPVRPGDRPGPGRAGPSILDRPAERPDELPTMLHQDDLVAASAQAPAAAGSTEGSTTSRPALASEDAP